MFENTAQKFSKNKLKVSSERKEVVVIGAGITGICAAVAAARAGANVALIDQRNSPGGRLGSDFKFPFEVLNSPNFPYAREGGLLDEIFFYLLKENHEGNYFGQGRVLMNFLLCEKRLETFLDHQVIEVSIEKCKTRIAAVLAVSSSNSTRKHFKANYFIDCSGGGFISQMAGASGEWGVDRNEKSLFSSKRVTWESRIATTITITKAERTIPFECPEWVKIKWTDNNLSAKVDLLESLSANPLGDHNLEWIGPGKESDLSSEEIAWASWDYLKNQSPMKESFKSLLIENISPVAFVRNGFRGNGHYVLKPKDITEGKRFQDSIALGRAPLDTENGLMFSNQGKVSLHQPFEIPFRCLCSNSLKNLLWAGESSSATSHAASSLSHPCTSAQMGEAAGLATALASSSNSTTISKSTTFISKLRESLHRRNHRTCLDPINFENNLVLNSEVTPSTNLETFIPSKYNQEKTNLLDHCLIQFPLFSGFVESIQVCFKNEQNINLEWRLLEGSSHNHFLPGACICSEIIKVSKNSGQWIKIKVDATASSSAWHFLELKSDHPILLFTQKNSPPGILLHRKKTLADKIANNPFSDFVPIVSKNPEPSSGPLLKVIPEQSPYHANNVINSNDRPTNLPNLWVSQSTTFNYPEYLEFRWRKKTKISTVEITFDSTSEFLIPQRPLTFERKIISSLVKDYNLYYHDEVGHSKKLLEVRNNSLGFRTHEFGPIFTDYLELEILATHGIDRVQIYQFRAFS